MTTVIVGLQWGDEGKGKIVDFLAEKADFVVRFHGGAGAGHTIARNGQIFKLHLIPCGIFNPKTKLVIANGVVVDPVALLEEIKAIEKTGMKIQSRILVSPRCQMVMPYHKILDGIFDEAKGYFKTATTKKGNGPVHADKVSYYGLTLGDLLYPKIFKRKLAEILPIKNKIIQSFGGQEFNQQNLIKEYLSCGRKIKSFFTNTYEVLNQAIKQKKEVIFEGAHGIFLDVDWGTYPYVTASSILPANIAQGAGINPRKIDRALGIVKAYITRVDTGACPMPTEIKRKTADFLREKAGEYGATTGRPRRLGWLDLVSLKFAAQLCGITEMAITKLDMLSGFKTIPVCVDYFYQGKSVNYLDLHPELLRKIKPKYKKFVGWQEDVSKTREYRFLPKNLRKYLEFIEKFVSVPIKIISVGPTKEQTIIR